MVVSGTQALRYAITDLAGSRLASPSARQARFVEQVRRWAADGVDFVQLREKQLATGELLALAESALAVLRDRPHRRTRLLVNGRPDVAAAAGADGVHLAASDGELRPEQARQIFAVANLPGCVVTASAHSVQEVLRAVASGADVILFGPVFEKRVSGQIVVHGVGLGALRGACAAAGGVPVLALGGVTADRSAACLHAGAAGVAGIRLFG